MVAEESTPMFSAMPEDLGWECIHDEAYCWRNVRDCSARAIMDCLTVSGLSQGRDCN